MDYDYRFPSTARRRTRWSSVLHVNVSFTSRTALNTERRRQFIKLRSNHRHLRVYRALSAPSYLATMTTAKGWDFLLSSISDYSQSALQHIFALHPHMCCYTCGFVSREENQLSAHYTTATLHPKCQVCNTGFKDLLLYKEVRFRCVNCTCYQRCDS